MKKKTIHRFILLSAIIVFFYHSTAQTLLYALPAPNDNRKTSIDLIGSYNGNIMLCKIKDKNVFISRYSPNLKWISDMPIKEIPKNASIIGIEKYPTSSYLLFEYTQAKLRRIAYILIDSIGQIIRSPQDIDTIDNDVANNFKKTSDPYFTLLHSDNKKNIVLYSKINDEDDKLVFQLLYFNSYMQKISKQTISIALNNNEWLSNILLDNEGNWLALRLNDNKITNHANYIDMIKTNAYLDTPIITRLLLPPIYFNEALLSIDHINRKYLISMIVQSQRGADNIGILNILWDPINNQMVKSSFIPFTNEMRQQVQLEGKLKDAFEDFYIRKIVFKKDGSFIVIAESYYSKTQTSSPYLSPFGYPSVGGFGSPYGFGYSPFNYYPGSFNNPYFNNYSTQTRYFSDNIFLLSVDTSLQANWNTAIIKSQYDNSTNQYLGFNHQIINGQLIFYYNQDDKQGRYFASSIVTPGGEVIRQPIVRNIRDKYTLMTRFAKRLNFWQVFIPADYRGIPSFVILDTRSE